MKNGEKIRLGDVPWTPKKYPRGSSVKAWDARGTPSSSIKSTRSFFNALYFYCFMHYVLFLERTYFCCVFIFFVCSIKLDPTYFVLERDTLLNSYIEHSTFNFHCFLVF